MSADRTPADWHRVEELLGAVLERDASERDAFLDGACDGDVELRREIESLLAAHERSGVLDRLADDIAPLASRLREPAPSSPMVGRRIGRYRVLERFAGGGMGIVYKAVDEQLDRTIALKFLHPRLGADDSAAERFRREARAIAALEHPNVCTVHEIGETDDGQLYLAMPLYDGETLQQRIDRGPLAVGEAVAIAAQIARGLAKAHGRGIVHRDIKPSNVLVTEDGVAKILDFGIAKLTDVTLTGAAAGPLGTAAYMSPEQVRGGRVDQRTDLWSLGVVLYEMLAGQRPFDGGGMPALAVSIQHAEPSPLSTHRTDVPPALERVVARALAKSPDERYQAAQDLEHDLLALRLIPDSSHIVAAVSAPRAGSGQWTWRRSRSIARGTAFLTVIALATALWVGHRSRRTAAPVSDAPGRSIVVRPFAAVAMGREDEYIGDGLTEEIIAHLAVVPGLKVISRTSAMRYKGSTARARQIADELKVAHVLEGSVQRRDGQLHVVAQLIDARSNAPRWSASYDVAPRDLPRVHREITQAVVGSLAIELGERERSTLARQGTRDAVAYDYYRRGRYLWNTRTREGHEKAIEYYERAIARDSTYAEPYAGLADVYLTSYQLGLSDRSEAEAYSRLKWAAERAIALDDQSADAHTSIAVSLWWQRNWPGAERELRRALELNPGNSTARSWYGLLLGGMGRLPEALRESRLAAELDPFAVIIRINLAWECYLARDYDCAIEQYHRTLEINGSWVWAHAQLGLLYAQQGRHAEGIREVTRAVELAPQRAEQLANLAYVHALAGNRVEARRLLQRAKRRSAAAFSVALAHVALGEADSAFVWLERCPWQWPNHVVRADPSLDPIRSDPRFASLSKRVDRELGLQ